MGAVGIQESPGQVDDLFSSPGKDQTGLFRDHSHLHRLQIFFFRVFQEFPGVPGIHHHGHTLLGFGDGQLRAVQTGVFLRYFIQIDAQAVRQLSDGHRDAAGAEIVALFDQTAHLRAPEHALDLSLCGSVSLLHLRPAGLQGSGGVHFGGTGGPADAVPAGAASQQDNQISRIGIFPDHIPSGSGSHDRPDLHSLGHIVGMVHFFYVSRSQSHLVAVRAVAFGGSPGQGLLGQLALQSILHRNCGIRRAGNPHGLIDIGTA